MKKILSILLLFSCVQVIGAQELLIDSLYKVRPLQTEIYAEKDGEELIIDLYLPEKNNSEKLPLIVWMHGGGFAGGSPKNPQEIQFAKMAASRGYAVGLISYRLVRKGTATGFGCDFDATGKLKTFQLAAEDFMDAVLYLEKKAENFNIDTENIIVGGSSAGAEAVLNAVYNPDLMFEDTSKFSNLNISAVFSLAGAIADVRYLTKEQAIPGIFFHGTADNLVPYATAPHHYCENNKPGYLILDGSKTIVDKLEKLDTSYLFYTFQDARHEISGMPFQYLPQVFEFLKNVVFNDQKIQSTIYK
ncbi:alpha/beta hydrolase fold domain-containing protein [Gramella lutea]|uniref:Alpha/beta hydrolase fold domain-containing protein n=1 Tax=Christiangramia lutea TaxID=1607951 RepID=A0A9X2A9J8_9FLAO|nr:alpha/beta hydrolase [Christiangramia lutea]MCH4821772.1 alpha/beta hydrolase fold domain-containing protein [Christiangramia lutea]